MGISNEMLAVFSIISMFGLFCTGFPISYTMIFSGLLFGFLGFGKLTSICSPSSSGRS